MKTVIYITNIDGYLFEHDMPDVFGMDIHNAYDCFMARNEMFDPQEFMEYVDDKGFNISLLED